MCVDVGHHVTLFENVIWCSFYCTDILALEINTVGSGLTFLLFLYFNGI